MENSLPVQKTISTNSVFNSRFLDSKSLYLYSFNCLPSLHFINSVNGLKAYPVFKEMFAGLIESEYQYRWYHPQRKRYEFDTTIFLMKNNCLVELDDYCRILHDGTKPQFLEECTALMKRFKERAKRKPLEINIIVHTSYGLDLKAMEIRRTKLDLDLFYEDDFKEINDVILQRLNQKKDKGLVLLHGLPGTGKTTYLRYLIGRLKKRVLFLSSGIAGNLMSPEFVDLLIDNPDTVLVIEDAENIIMDRRLGGGGDSVSNLLNISDGLMADFLNVQIICTFNSPLTMVDAALLRKGRLIAKYEFGKLNTVKAQKLSDHLGYASVITQPMTVAEISNQSERAHEAKSIEVIGFRTTGVFQN